MINIETNPEKQVFQFYGNWFRCFQGNGSKAGWKSGSGGCEIYLSEALKCLSRIYEIIRLNG